MSSSAPIALAFANRPASISLTITRAAAPLQGDNVHEAHYAGAQHHDVLADVRVRIRDAWTAQLSGSVSDATSIGASPTLYTPSAGGS